VIFHSIVGSAEGAYGYFLNSTNLESHFIIRKNGHIIQLIDTSRDADAQPYDGAISIETEDNGNPNTDPWTDEQIASLIVLTRWLLRVHEIPLRRAPSPYAGGIGYHSMFGAPSPWTPAVGKTCPGTVRIHQFDNVILPMLLNGEEKGSVVDMITPDSAEAAIRDFQSDLNFVNTGYEKYMPEKSLSLALDGDWGPKTQERWRRAAKILGVWLPKRDDDPRSKMYEDWVGRSVLRMKMEAAHNAIRRTINV
jgi:peptidoglycan hydrolase-like protein with peptidoglycan-binding domain